MAALHLGAGLLEEQVTTTTTTALQPAGTQTKLSPFSVVAGAQAGFNYQIQQVVIGAEGTYTWSNISGTQMTPSLHADLLRNVDLDAALVRHRDRQARLRRQRLLVLCQRRRGVDGRELHPDRLRRRRQHLVADDHRHALAASPSAAASNTA